VTVLEREKEEVVAAQRDKGDDAASGHPAPAHDASTEATTCPHARWRWKIVGGSPVKQVEMLLPVMNNAHLNPHLHSLLSLDSKQQFGNLQEQILFILT
jgi:hypothetical protein